MFEWQIISTDFFIISTTDSGNWLSRSIYGMETITLKKKRGSFLAPGRRVSLMRTVLNL